MLETVRQIIQKFTLIPPQAGVLVGVSGGADSLALLHLLHTLSQRLNFHLYAATLNHGLRGDEGADDAAFVELICKQWGIPVTVGKVDVQAEAQRSGQGVETIARNMRYAFLANTAEHIGASHIAVAHHADDQAETVLLHLLRGAGGHGLAGMRLISSLPHYPHLMLIRPLLHTTRAEIEIYCHENGLTSRQDSTNTDTTILRNRLRHETVPHLANFNPRIRQVLAQLAEISAVEDDYLESEIHRLDSELLGHVHSAHITIDRSAFCRLHPALARRFIIHCARQLVAVDDLPDYQHVTEAIALACTGRQGAKALLGGDLHLRVNYESLIIERTDAKLQDSRNFPTFLEDTEIPVVVPGETLIGGWMLTASFEKIENIQARLAFAKGSLVNIRSIREGDRFAPLGLKGHTQKLNRWLINHKVPRDLRKNTLLLCVNGNIAAIMLGAEWTISEHFAVLPDSAHVVYFQFRQYS